MLAMLACIYVYKREFVLRIYIYVYMYTLSLQVAVYGRTARVCPQPSRVSWYVAKYVAKYVVKYVVKYV